MPSKGTFVSNVFENLEDLGKSTVKKSVSAVKNTFNPVDLIGKAVGMEVDNRIKNKNTTPLDLKKLQEKYQDKDKVKLDAYRQKLFQLVKSGEEKVFNEKKQEQTKKQQQETYSDEEKKKQQQKTPKFEESQGKVKKSILGNRHKKANVALERSVEYKQNAGK